MATSTITERFVISEEEAKEIIALKSMKPKRVNVKDDFFQSKEERMNDAKKILAALQKKNGQ